MQRTHFCAKSARNNLEPTISLKRNFYFEMEGAWHYIVTWLIKGDTRVPSKDTDTNLTPLPPLLPKEPSWLGRPIGWESINCQVSGHMEASGNGWKPQLIIYSRLPKYYVVHKPIHCANFLEKHFIRDIWYNRVCHTSFFPFSILREWGHGTLSLKGRGGPILRRLRISFFSSDPHVKNGEWRNTSCAKVLLQRVTIKLSK